MEERTSKKEMQKHNVIFLLAFWVEGTAQRSP